jgi:hypothetical protein
MTGIIINLPYSAAALPPALARRLALTQEERQLEHWRLIDPPLADIAREAAHFTRRSVTVDHPVITYPLSPLVADPWGLWAAELAEDAPAAGEPAAPPRPALLPRTTAGKPINWPARDREIIFGRSVIPFHQEIAAAAGRLLADSPLVLVITLRSFGSAPLDFERSRRYPRPQAAVSGRPGSTPPGLLNLTGGVFKSCRWWAELGWPQDRGACLPAELIGHPRVRALGISLCRSLYLDEKTGRVKSSARGVIRVLKTILNLLDQELARVAGLRLERAAGAKPLSPAPPALSPVIKAAHQKTAPPAPEGSDQ